MDLADRPCNNHSMPKRAGFRWTRLGALAGWLVLFWALPAAAQEGPTILEFSFSNPGARSLGFGGAFVALADDATAAFANPAGLIQLTRPELSIEGRQWSFSTPFTLGGRATGTPTGLGLDTTAGLRFDESQRDVSGVSFLSFVYPMRSMAVAIYRHRLAGFEALTVTDGLFLEVPGAPGFVNRFPDQQSFWEFEIVTYGATTSFKLAERVSLGLGVGYNQVDFRAVTDVYSIDVSSIEGFFAPNPFTPERLAESLILSSGDSHMTVNVGLLWKLDSRWSLGAVYRSGIELNATLVDTAGAFADVPPGTPLVTLQDRIDLPDVFGLGAAYRSSGGAFTASFEWDRIRYSRIVETLDPGVFDTEGLRLDDADELHLGFEYAFLNSRPLIALRLGAWLDPDHRIRNTNVNDPVSRAILQQGDDEIHLSVGVGVALKFLQLDLAVDLSERVDTVAVSAIHAF